LLKKFSNFSMDQFSTFYWKKIIISSKTSSDRLKLIYKTKKKIIKKIMSSLEPLCRVRKLNAKQFSSGLRGHRRTYFTNLESADHALFKMVRYVLLRRLRPELKAFSNEMAPKDPYF
jgi:hypothetical protein